MSTYEHLYLAGYFNSRRRCVFIRTYSWRLSRLGYKSWPIFLSFLKFRFFKTKKPPNYLFIYYIRKTRQHQNRSKT